MRFTYLERLQTTDQTGKQKKYTFPYKPCLMSCSTKTFTSIDKPAVACSQDIINYLTNLYFITCILIDNVIRFYNLSICQLMSSIHIMSKEALRGAVRPKNLLLYAINISGRNFGPIVAI